MGWKEAKWAPGGLSTFEELGEEEELMKRVSRGSGRRKTREEYKSERCFNWELRFNPLKKDQEKGRWKKAWVTLQESNRGKRHCGGRSEWEGGGKESTECRWLLPEWYFPKCTVSTLVAFKAVLKSRPTTLEKKRWREARLNINN